MMSPAKHPVTLRRRISYWLTENFQKIKWNPRVFDLFRFESCMWRTLGRIRKLAEITSQIAPVLTLSHLQEECHYFMQVFATQNMIELATVKPLLTTCLLQNKLMSGWFQCTTKWPLFASTWSLQSWSSSQQKQPVASNVYHTKMKKKRSILVDSDPFIWEYTEYVYTRCWIY